MRAVCETEILVSAGILRKRKKLIFIFKRSLTSPLNEKLPSLDPLGSIGVPEVPAVDRMEKTDGTTSSFQASLSGPPMSPSFKARGVKPQVWTPMQQPSRSAIPKEFYGAANPSHTSSVPPPSHSSLSMPSAMDDRVVPSSTHNGVYSPSSSSSGFVSNATISDRAVRL